MWISKYQLDRLKERIEQLENRENMPNITHYTDPPRGSETYWYSLPDSVIKMRLDDAVKQIMNHVGLEIKRTAAQPEKVELVKKKK